MAFGYYLGGVYRGGPTVKQRITTLVACGLLAVALIGVAAAGPLEDGQAAYQRGDFATALQIFRPLAEQGNAAAQRMLGAAFASGQGVPQDYVSAHMWLNLAATSRATDPAARDQAARERDMLAAKMTPAQIAEAQRLASELRPKK
jgi:TPR repeat protein